MPKYVMCRGCPASGKSTWAKKQSGYEIINRDTIRREHFPSKNYPGYVEGSSTESGTTAIQKRLVEDCAALGANVIDDNTNLTAKYFNQSIKLAESLGFDVEVKEFFDVSISDLLSRNVKREHSVPEDVLHRMYATQMEIQGRVIVPTPGLPECVLIDVDGTIAEMGKGESWGRKPFEWHKVSQDRPKLNVCSVVKSLLANRLMNGSAPTPVFLSGRDGVCFDDTREWIYQHIFPGYIGRDSVVLHMRKPNDSRQDCVVKEELLREHILPKFNIAFSIDDRDSVVHHYRALGIECWQVAAGRF
jgi:predicted kinase